MLSYMREGKGGNAEEIMVSSQWGRTGGPITARGRVRLASSAEIALLHAQIKKGRRKGKSETFLETPGGKEHPARYALQKTACRDLNSKKQKKKKPLYELKKAGFNAIKFKGREGERRPTSSVSPEEERKAGRRISIAPICPSWQKNCGPN